MSPEPVEGRKRKRFAVIIVMIPLGAIVGFVGGLLIEIVVGLIVGAAFSAEHAGTQAWRVLGSLPRLGALIGAIVAPIWYGRDPGSAK